MALISFANLDQAFDPFLSTPNLVTWTGGTPGFNFSSLWLWNSAAGHTLSFSGDNLTYSGNTPTGGTLSSFLLDLNSDSPFSAELLISGLSLDAVSFAPLTQTSGGNPVLTVDQQNNLVWRLLFGGDDTITLGSSANAANFSIGFGGDGLTVEAGQTLYGGDDAISGSTGALPGGNLIFCGDYVEVVAGGRAFGGNDVFTNIGGGVFVGDVGNVHGFLSGGNDTMTGDAANIFGDVGVVNAGGILVGGDDTITATVAGQRIIGDASGVETGGILIGGDDTLNGSQFGDFLTGDVTVASAGASVRAGDDTIHGNGGDDEIDGDWYQDVFDPGAFGIGGNDVLYGDAGNDNIFGQGGNDEIHGGADRDNMHGDDGDDVFFIDLGSDVVANETYDGGNGTDTIRFTDPAGFITSMGGVTLTSIEALIFANTGATMASLSLNASQFGSGLLALNAAITGNANTAVNDRLVVAMGGVVSLDLSNLVMTNFAGPNDFISINGGAGGQTITGSDVNDFIDGGADNDTLNGGDGNDVLIVGAGTDTLTGGNGIDRIEYLGSANVIFDLVGLVALGTGLGSDTLTDLIENATSGSGNDIFAGNALVNVLDGGAGVDTISYYQVSGNVIIDLAGNTGVDGTSTDTLLNFENANGGHGNDQLSGRQGIANRLDGLDNGAGGDTVSYYLDNVSVNINLGTSSSVQNGVVDTLLNFENANGSRVGDSITGTSGNNVINGLGGADLLTGNGGNDTFVFARQQAAGDSITDFVGNGAGVGDTLRFTGYGTAAQGSTFTFVSGNTWQIHSGLFNTNELITINGGAGAVHATDFVFV